MTATWTCASIATRRSLGGRNNEFRSEACTHAIELLPGRRFLTWGMGRRCVGSSDGVCRRLTWGDRGCELRAFPHAWAPCLSLSMLGCASMRILLCMGRDGSSVGAGRSERSEQRQKVGRAGCAPLVRAGFGANPGVLVVGECSCRPSLSLHNHCFTRNDDGSRRSIHGLADCDSGIAPLYIARWCSITGAPPLPSSRSASSGPGLCFWICRVGGRGRQPCVDTGDVVRRLFLCRSPVHDGRQVVAATLRSLFGRRDAIATSGHSGHESRRSSSRIHVIRGGALASEGLRRTGCAGVARHTRERNRAGCSVSGRSSCSGAPSRRGLHVSGSLRARARGARKARGCPRSCFVFFVGGGVSGCFQPLTLGAMCLGDRRVLAEPEFRSARPR